jgi:DNA-binding IclR family transcriptional regulator
MTLAHISPLELTPAELAILDTLRDGRWRTSVEVADEMRLLPFAARLLLRNLGSCGFVRRSASGLRTGSWQITETGAAEADRHDVARTLP